MTVDGDRTYMNASIDPIERISSGLHEPFYDPTKTYEENYDNGPFGEFANGEKFEQVGEPEHEVLGQKVYLPFGIPAGPLLNAKFVIVALDKGFDIVAYKTVRTRSHPSNPFPNVLAVHPEGDLTLAMANEGLVGDTNYTRPISITNSFAVPAKNPDVWQQDMKQAVRHARKGQFVIGGFQGTTGGGEAEYIKDFVTAARLVKETGVPVLEANLSCPNEGTAHLLCFDLERTQRITGAIKDEIGNTPLIIKIAYFSDQDRLEELMKRVGNIVDGVAAINTIPTKIWKDDTHTEQALPGANRLVAGVCGQPIKWAGLEMVERLRKLREELSLNFEIIGVGGVTKPQDYFEYRNLGADGVMSATGAMWNPFLAQEIKSQT